VMVLWTSTLLAKWSPTHLLSAPVTAANSLFLALFVHRLGSDPVEDLSLALVVEMLFTEPLLYYPFVTGTMPADVEHAPSSGPTSALSCGLLPARLLSRSR
jgi:hypothetical protein